MPNNSKGFTLIEMLVAMAVGLIVMGGIYTAYVNHQRSHVTQQLVVDMQQNARAALALMKREIRMAGYDPWATDGVDNDGAAGIDDAGETADDEGEGFLMTAIENEIQFKADINGDGDDDDPNEKVTYRLVNGTELQRNGQVVAYDIEAIGFAYAVDDDIPPDGIDLSPNGFVEWIFDSNDGENRLDQIVDTNDDGVIAINDAEGGANKPGPQVEYGKIRAVRIWLLARTRHPIKDHTDNRTYVVGAIRKGPADSDWDPGRKRLLLTTTIYCRNMGL